MKAITVCQPYAHLIALPENDPRMKRIENRSWSTPYVGPLAIHAGKGTQYMQDEDWQEFPGLAWGAIVAVCRLEGCFGYQGIVAARPTVPAWVLNKWPWMDEHRHVEGPVCWALSGVRRLKEPVRCSGQRGLWDVPQALRATIEAQLGNQE